MSDFETYVRLLDSENIGEAQNAFTLARKHQASGTFPKYSSLLDKDAALLDQIRSMQASSVPLDIYNAKCDELEQLKHNGPARSPMLHALRWKIQTMPPAIRLLAYASIIAAALCFGWNNLISPSRPDTLPNAVEAKLARLLPDAQWTDDAKPKPIVMPLRGAGNFWVLVVGSTDAGTLADANGRTITRQCVTLFAAPAVSRGGAWLSPHPFDFLGRVRWRKVASECRLPQGT